jgi:hypothetical protein
VQCTGHRAALNGEPRPIIYAMTRVRVSTTVDAQRWATAQRLVGAPSSQILDRALAALIGQLEGAHEREVLTAQPYHEDPELAWEMSPGAGLAYDADVPPDVLELARQRRARRAAE